MKDTDKLLKEVLAALENVERASAKAQSKVLELHRTHLNSHADLSHKLEQFLVILNGTDYSFNCSKDDDCI